MTDHVDVLVLGGGPAGSTVATLAAKTGARVRLLEASRHPRPHVGESLLPGITPILADMGALAAVQRAGFSLKTGSTHLRWGVTPRWDLWFADSDAYETSWFVERERFDAILFDCATASGVETLTHAAVRSLQWQGDTLQSVTWRDAGGAIHETTATHVVDASGAAALVARDRGWVEPIAGMAHQALWAHFEHVEHLPAPRAHQAVFIAEAGHWIWCFPLADGRASVGVVELAVDTPKGGSAHFDALVSASSALRRVLGSAAMRCSGVRRERDFSYRVRPAGLPGVRLVGDAAGFIDPVLSTGVFLAMHAAWDAAHSLTEPDEISAASGYAKRHARQFDDLLRMVCFYYQQGLTADDYFWESKRIVIDSAGALSPRRAFAVLTSGLIDNLAMQRPAQSARQRRAAETQETVESLAVASAPTEFFCVHLRVPFSARPGQVVHDLDGDRGDPAVPRTDRASIYIVVEPDDPVAPCFARTPSLSIDVVAPRLGNDPGHGPNGRDPGREQHLAPTLRSFVALLRRLDAAGLGIAALWRDHGHEIDRWTAALPLGIAHVRTFGR
ncbi:MAG: tryptophan 7-halogenase [Nannocystaceae bacterium]|nr:tryptophan 7-halogenase [Nannocystaceae bacterium]